MRSPVVMPHLSGVEVHALQIAADRIDLQVVARQPRAPCPVCQRPSARVHSRYERHLADRPWSGVRVTLHVLARGFRCLFTDCPRRIFCERLPSLAAAYARRTHPLTTLRQALGLARGGRPSVRLLRRSADQLEQVPVPGAPGLPVGLVRPDRQAARERTRREMHARLTAIQQARATGLSLSATARALGVHRHTIEKYDRLAAPPERRHTWRRPSAPAPYAGYLQERRRQGARKALPLWRELKGLGYAGAYQNVARFLAALRKVEAAGGSGLLSVRGLTARRTVSLALIRPERRTAAEARALAQVMALGPEIATLLHLLEQFARLIRRQGSDPIRELAKWKQAAVATGWEELGTCVARLQQDQAAVEAALGLPYSQGQTDGRSIA